MLHPGSASSEYAKFAKKLKVLEPQMFAPAHCSKTTRPFWPPLLEPELLPVPPLAELVVPLDDELMPPLDEELTPLLDPEAELETPLLDAEPMPPLLALEPTTPLLEAEPTPPLDPELPSLPPSLRVEMAPPHAGAANARAAERANPQSATTLLFISPPAASNVAPGTPSYSSEAWAARRVSPASRAPRSWSGKRRSTLRARRCVRTFPASCSSRESRCTRAPSPGGGARADRARRAAPPPATRGVYHRVGRSVHFAGR